MNIRTLSTEQDAGAITRPQALLLQPGCLSSANDQDIPRAEAPTWGSSLIRRVQEVLMYVAHRSSAMWKVRKHDYSLVSQSVLTCEVAHV